FRGNDGRGQLHGLRRTRSSRSSVPLWIGVQRVVPCQVNEELHAVWLAQETVRMAFLRSVRQAFAIHSRNEDDRQVEEAQVAFDGLTGDDAVLAAQVDV